MSWNEEMRNQVTNDCFFVREKEKIFQKIFMKISFNGKQKNPPIYLK